LERVVSKHKEYCKTKNGLLIDAAEPQQQDDKLFEADF
jgi:hypothetical protein